MWFEILITLILVAVSAFILYKNIKKKASGNCDCGSCSTHCPNYDKEHKIDTK